MVETELSLSPCPPKIRSVPSLTVVAPVKPLLPNSSTWPVPSLVRVPVPVTMSTKTLMFPAPPKVRPRFVPVMPPLVKVSVPDPN